MEQVNENMSGVQEWDPTILPEHFSMIVYGRRRSGKTFQLRQFIHDIRKRFTDVYLFSDTAHLQDEDYSYVPEKNRIRGLDENRMEEILDKQREIIEMNKTRKKKDCIKSTPLILLDDIISDPKVRHSPVLNSLYTLGRHTHISVVTLTQEIGGKFGVPRVLRSNADCVIGFYAHSEVDRKMICQQYASVTDGGSKEGGIYYKTIASEPYTSAVFDLTNVEARRYEDYIYKYRVPEKQPKFMIGQDKLKTGKKASKVSKLSNVKPVVDDVENYVFDIGGRQQPMIKLTLDVNKSGDIKSIDY